MKSSYSFNDEQMNGIVEETYKNIILECNNLIKETHELMKSDKRINYQGFVEADEITSTNNHVIVTDGFSGNIALKTAEGVSKFITSSLKKSLTSSPYSKFLSLLLKKNFNDFKKLRAKKNPINR